MNVITQIHDKIYPKNQKEICLKCLLCMYELQEGPAKNPDGSTIIVDTRGAIWILAFEFAGPSCNS
jgi:hypothetical protein